MSNVILLIIMTMMGSFAAFCLKKASDNKEYSVLLKNNFFYYGGILYFLSALINIYLLRILPYSVVLPLTSITYIWTMVISYVFLKERISFKKVFGVIFIVLGAMLVAL
ncbi:putative membrane protein [Desulfitobacterium sp. LBE]|uniref:EamA family transporter n=1 Tax=Desulfitobacterium sp. LBE TaxID=884086 RepID=UPI00119C701F|nr:EamA family transporter [Desulfitobacterium sp. LBE]TWH59738.1 putative membrane protein [Desulfitobacterium sp. LBE]